MTTGSRKQQLDDVVDALAARWDDEPTHILVHAFPMLAEGVPVPIRRLAERAGVDERTAVKAVRTSKAETDDQSNITSLFGIGFSPTVHRVVAPAAALYTCCGLVAQTVARLAQVRIQIRSADPVSGTIIKLDVSPSGLRDIDPGNAVCTFARGARDDMINRPYQTFCRHIRYFESEKTAEEFIRLETVRFPVDIADCYWAAELLVEKAWGIGRRRSG